MKATTAIFVTWVELDEFLKKWGKETFGEECLCESGSADESWSIQISFQTSFLTDQRNESALRDINERYKSLIEQYGSEDDAPEDGGYPVTKDSSAQLTLDPS